MEGRLHDVLRTSDTRVVVRFTTQANPAGSTVAGTNYFSFDPTTGRLRAALPHSRPQNGQGVSFRLDNHPIMGATFTTK